MEISIQLKWPTAEPFITFWNDGDDWVVGLSTPAPSDYRVTWEQVAPSEGAGSHEVIVRKGEREILRQKRALHEQRWDNFTVLNT